jgi:hypothetical protein
VRDEFPGDEERRGFIKDEFEGRLGAYCRASRAWRAAQIFVWVLAALLGC